METPPPNSPGFGLTSPKLVLGPARAAKISNQALGDSPSTLRGWWELLSMWVGPPIVSACVAEALKRGEPEGHGLACQNTSRATASSFESLLPGELVPSWPRGHRPPVFVRTVTSNPGYRAPPPPPPRQTYHRLSHSERLILTEICRFRSVRRRRQHHCSGMEVS